MRQRKKGKRDKEVVLDNPSANESALRRLGQHHNNAIIGSGCPSHMPNLAFKEIVALKYCASLRAPKVQTRERERETERKRQRDKERTDIHTHTH